MKQRVEWDIDGTDWPNRRHSKFIAAAGLDWHVQIMGQGPVALLIHGTGASTHSWAAVAPLLAARYTVVAVDLPGHGFSGLDSRHRLSLRWIADALAALLAALDLQPEVVVGHSAGAAIGLRLICDGVLTPRVMISLNGALKSFSGLEAFLFPTLAKLLFANPFAPALMAWQASDSSAVARIIAGTGSTLDAGQLAFYVRLLRTTRHVGAALGMMAHWDLPPLERALPGLTIPLVLVTAAGDRAVPPSVARDIHAKVPSSTLITVPGLGHLAHEENPTALADLILNACI